ncbi:TPA: restriction endonuclease subunit S [Serratia marcescens]|nr:restriction endonuclease subunit S [Serratia marcescens]
MAKYKVYPEYKDSGLSWCDTLPLRWKTSRLRWLSYIYAGGTPSKNVTEYWDNGTIPWINSGSVNQGYIIEPSEYISKGAYKNSSAKWIPKGSLVLALAGQGKTKGMVAQLGIDTTCNQSMAAIVFYEKSKSRYIYWWLVSNYQNIRNMSGGDLRDGLNLEVLGGIACPQPSMDESHKIASFLDHETAKIDNLIEKQQQLIELLKEKCQAVISHAVTKGLNSDVPMKDSGVEWLGEVPEHWEVKRIKHFGKVIGGFAFKSTDFTDEGYPVIKISNVSHLSFDWGDSSFLPLNFSFMHKEYLAPNGALVFAMTRPVISGGIKVTLLDDDSAPLVNQRVGFMVVKNKDMARYILISTQSSAFLAHFVNNMTVTNQPNISSEGIESIYIPVPPRNEISRILHYVGRMNESYNGLIAKALLQVSLLQERRTALISAAVTGKIDVRDWVAPDMQDAEEPQETTA